jgi:hypothetical protein
MTVIQFPVKVTCDQCLHFLCGPTGMYCNYWREDIINEDSAQECESFTRD